MSRARAATLVALIALSLRPPAAGAVDAAADGMSARVVNGVLTQERPTTGVLLSTSGINHQLVCSGTLIGCQTFLTAAHCVCDGSPFSQCGTPQPSQYSVFLQDVGIVGVSAIDVDPSYSFGTRGDLAVVTLSLPVTGVAPTPINTTTRPPFGTTAEVAGYGVTGASASDAGILRRGLVETSACADADPAWHVCWSFTDPVGAPGLDSDTCFGDSGGPLFADLGAGTTIVGVTSGGTASDCLPTDNSYDTDVYVHRAFIQGIGGADLSNTSCGSIAQVGEPGAVRATFDFDTLSRAQQDCRKELSKQAVAYSLAALRAWQSCLDGVGDGSRSAPCPDADATADLAAAAATRIRLDKLEAKCPDAVVPTIGAEGACAAAMTASDLAACIEMAADDAVASALDSEYADDSPNGTIADAGARECQEAVAKASAGLLKSSLKLATRCQVSLASGKVGSCPDAKTTTGLAKAEDKLSSRIQGVCSNAEVAALDGVDPFGGSCAGVTTAAALAACEIADHDGVTAGMVALLADQTMETDVSFTVPPGTALLRVTLNGQDSGVNDLDLYVRQGAPATTSAWDAKSENGGMFEETEIASPAAGTWHVHLARFSGPTLIPYQVSATAFQP